MEIIRVDLVVSINCNLQIQNGDNLSRFSGFKSRNNGKDYITGFNIDNDSITTNLEKSI